MSDVIWKSFCIKNEFTRVAPPSTNTPAKNLNISKEPFDGSIALITRGETNNGIRGYIEKKDYPTSTNKITYNDQFSLFLFHNYEFTTIKDHLSLFVASNKKLMLILDNHPFINVFLVTILNYIFSKEIFHFNFTGADFKFDREIILLPCLEVIKEDDYIWEENGHYYTLAVEYIKKLMNEAKELREQKTIRLYEAERAKYEAERAKYEEGYAREKELLVWKSFKLGELFEWSSKHKISKSAKEYNEIDHYEDGYVANVTAGMYNEGIACYLPINDEINSKKIKNCLTISSNGAGVGACFYHNYYVVSTGDNALLQNINSGLQKVFDESTIVPLYFAKLITKLFRNNGIFSWSYKVSKDDFKREIILLPCLEVIKEDDYIWEENGHYYTLAVEYISYLYLTGKMNYNQKRINEYTYLY